MLLACLLTIASPAMAQAQQEGQAAPDAPVPQLKRLPPAQTLDLEMGSLTPAQLLELEQQRQARSMDDPSWARPLGGKWSVGAGRRLAEPRPPWDEETGPTGPTIERQW